MSRMRRLEHPVRAGWLYVEEGYEIRIDETIRDIKGRKDDHRHDEGRESHISVKYHGR